MENGIKGKGQVFFVLVVVIISLEIYCAKISYDNYAWWMPPFLFILTALNLFPIIWFLKNRQTLAIVSLLSLGFLIVPKQLILSHKYILEQEEGANITNHVYQHKLSTGQFPENLTKYKFKYPELQNDFIYSKDSESDFTVRFSVGTKSTSHFFIHHGDGKWQYYDD